MSIFKIYSTSFSETTERYPNLLLNMFIADLNGSFLVLHTSLIRCHFFKGGIKFDRKIGV